MNTTNILDLAKDVQRVSFCLSPAKVSESFYPIPQRERPLINFDITGIIMVSMITVVSTLFSIMLRTFFRPFAVEETLSRTVPDDSDGTRTAYNTLKEGFVKYGFNTHECTQRMVCGMVKNALHDRKLNGKSASHFSRIVEGLSR